MFHRKQINREPGSEKKFVFFLRRKTVFNLSIAIVFVLVLMFFSIYFFADNVSRAYSSSFLPFDNVYSEINYETFKEKYDNNEDFLLFYSKPTCGACKQYISPLNRLAKKKGIKVVYYLNADKITESQRKNLHNIYGVSASTPVLLYYSEKELTATSCLNLIEENGGFICEYNNGEQQVRDGILNAAEYIFSLYNKEH